MRFLIIFLITINIVFLQRAEAHYLRVSVTSIERTPREQAIAMYFLKKKGVNLVKLYKNKEVAKKLQDATSISEMTSIIEYYVGKGVYISKHLCEKAFDLRKNRNSRKLLKVLSKDNNLKILDEGDHYHIELKESCNIN